MNWREDGESKSEGKRVRMNGGGGGRRVEGVRGGEMEVAWRDSERELERIFERMYGYTCQQAAQDISIV